MIDANAKRSCSKAIGHSLRSRLHSQVYQQFGNSLFALIAAPKVSIIISTESLLYYKSLDECLLCLTISTDCYECLCRSRTLRVIVDQYSVSIELSARTWKLGVGTRQPGSGNYERRALAARVKREMPVRPGRRPLGHLHSGLPPNLRSHAPPRESSSPAAIAYRSVSIAHTLCPLATSMLYVASPASHSRLSIPTDMCCERLHWACDTP